MRKKIAVLPGDGIGPEVIGEAIKVCKAIGDKFKHEFLFKEGIVGAASIFKNGDPYPEETHELCLNSDSVLFLNKAMDFVKKLDGRIINLDINLICDYPKINPIKLKLKKNLSNLLDLEINKINIKATTTEDQGFINFKKGIASQAIVSIEAFNEE